MFTHLDKEPLPKINTVQVDGKRHYALPNGTVAPSVTTVLSYRKEREKGLQDWIKKVGEKKANAQKIQGARRGSGLHEMIEKYLNNDPSYFKGYTPNIQAVFVGLKPFLNNIDNIWWQESCVYSERLGIAGRLDTVAEYNGTLTLCDFKGSIRPKKEEHIITYKLQLAAYGACVAEMTGIIIKQGAILIGVENNPPQVFLINPWDYIKELIQLVRVYKESHQPMNSNK